MTKKTIPINAKQLNFILLDRNKKYPLMWRKYAHIHERNMEPISKKYSLPFWPKSLKNEIVNIVGEKNNFNMKLSFIFQLNLEDFKLPNLPSQGLLQFYCSNNHNRSNDLHENEKDIIIKTLNINTLGAYQIVYIDSSYLKETPCTEDEINHVIEKYTDAETPYSLKFKQNRFEIGILHNSMYHILHKEKEDISTIHETFYEYIQSVTSDEINEAFSEIFKDNQEYFQNFQDTFYHPKLTFSHGNKSGGFPVYLDKDNRAKEVTKYDFLLFQIDTRVIEILGEDEINDYENIHKVIKNLPEYIMGLNVNHQDLVSWTKEPNINFKKYVATQFHKQYM